MNSQNNDYYNDREPVPRQQEEDEVLDPDFLLALKLQDELERGDSGCGLDDTVLLLHEMFPTEPLGRLSKLIKQTKSLEEAVACLTGEKMPNKKTQWKRLSDSSPAVSSPRTQVQPSQWRQPLPDKKGNSSSGERKPNNKGGMKQAPTQRGAGVSFLGIQDEQLATKLQHDEILQEKRLTQPELLASLPLASLLKFKTQFPEIEAETMEAIYRDTLDVEVTFNRLQSLSAHIPEGPSLLTDADFESLNHSTSSYASKLQGAELREHAQELRNQRDTFYQRAAAAYKQGDSATAGYLADEGRKLDSAVKKMNEAAGQRIFEENNNGGGKNSGPVIDLHGLQTQEALSRLTDFVKDYQKRLYPGSSQMLTIITGAGHHSTNQKAVLKPAVMSYLVSRGFVPEASSSGVVRVLVKSSKEN